MLRSLYIQNYALIEKLDISFSSGFSVITGETGAGKSIILGAIGLLLGQRADVKAIRVGASRPVLIFPLTVCSLSLRRMSWSTRKNASCAARCPLRARAGHSSMTRLLHWLR